jgi:alpha-D-ribose 1-methylphosphonate 5-triphosphate diphosphatase
MGAPNLVRGGSHAGKVAAGDLVAAGLVDALASDYHYPAPARAAFRLERDGMDLARAWALVSEGPARLLGLRRSGAAGTGMPGRHGRGGGGQPQDRRDHRGRAVSYMAGLVVERFIGAAA